MEAEDESESLWIKHSAWICRMCAARQLLPSFPESKEEIIRLWVWPSPQHSPFLSLEWCVEHHTGTQPCKEKGSLFWDRWSLRATFKSQHKRTPVFCKKCVPPNASWWSAEGAVTQFTQCLQHLENITNTINYAIGQITGLHWDLFCQACKGAVHTWANRWCSPLTTVVCVVPHKRREVWGIGMASQWVLQTMDRGLSKPQFGGT